MTIVGYIFHVVKPYAIQSLKLSPQQCQTTNENNYKLDTMNTFSPPNHKAMVSNSIVNVLAILLLSLTICVRAATGKL